MHHHSFQECFGGTEEDLRLNPAVNNNNVDRALYNDLVQIFPLVQFLIDQKASSSFTRRGSMIYTKKPSRESISNKVTEGKCRNAQSVPRKKRGENGGIEQVGGDDGLSVLSSSANLAKEREELIKLADKQAAVEKLQWEAMTSNKKVEKLQEDLNAIQGEASSYTLLFEGLSNDNYTLSHQDCYDVTPHGDHHSEIDDMDELEMEEAHEVYMAAVAAAKEKQNDESIAIAANARAFSSPFVQCCIRASMSVILEVESGLVRERVG
ncbi:hypothetical protein M8C21_022930 [Ambrosia artemisiifolia]|uniref:Uncharacterized protein n=1 Tax=Ambrosia artemisiifolia TaxID=4212 RepID=A0AAD5G3Z8_AMBAR|nr:hypothetical protein M8C21_022930 [Ambrosia artemisiifolia]